MNRLVVMCALACAAMGCDENLRDIAGPTPNLEPTFSAIQRDIFDAPDSSGRSACTSCHNAQGARFAGNLNLTGATAYAQLVNVASGEWRTACSTTERTIPAFFARRSSRLMPGWRARPEVTTTMSEPAVSA